MTRVFNKGLMIPMQSDVPEDLFSELSMIKLFL